MKRWHWWALGTLAAVSLAAEFIAPHDPAHWWTVIPAFYMFFGFFGCLLIIFFSKALGKLFLQQSEDYYGE
jgi:hypothetical protein